MRVRFLLGLLAAAFALAACVPAIPAAVLDQAQGEVRVQNTFGVPLRLTGVVMVGVSSATYLGKPCDSVEGEADTFVCSLGTLLPDESARIVFTPHVDAELEPDCLFSGYIGEEIHDYRFSTCQVR